MSKETSSIDSVIAAFVFVLASTCATLILFTLMFALNHQEWLAITIGSILILLLCLTVRNRSRAAFYGSLFGYTCFLINALKIIIEN